MLVNLTPNLKEIERRLAVAKEHNFTYIPQTDSTFLVETGIYRDNFDFNFSEDDSIEELERISDYGVADNVEQIKTYFNKYINNLTEKYIISITPVFQHKENKGEWSGWRWHKWGEYIGTLNPQCEYLDDEEFGENFQYVLCFNIYKVK